MDIRFRVGILTALLAAGGALAPAGMAAQDSLPPGVTREMVERGKQVFSGPGMCFACHGTAARGGAGPNLTDTVWIHSRGEFEKIVATITAGVGARQSRSGMMMPPRGGSAISDSDLRAVAAYVWSLSRPAVSPRIVGGSCGIGTD